jgi:hypothetical protein
LLASQVTTKRSESEKLIEPDTRRDTLDLRLALRHAFIAARALRTPGAEIGR